MTADKPGDNELEVSIFGPGVGECVVVHLGNGQWMVVDSCLDPKSREPVALEYLQSLGVKVERDVSHVIVTHWHDDHTRGASKVLGACESAEFFCAGALNKPEFFQIVASAGQLDLHADAGTGISEMARIFAVLEQRLVCGRVASPTYAVANTVLFRRGSSTAGTPCTVEALSPSGTSQTRALLSLAPVVSSPKRALPNPGPNELSVLLSVQFGSTAALLGADLETGTSDTVGWRAVVRNPRLPTNRAAIVKVPHHGSAGADHPPVWATLVAGNPHVGVTPFYSSGLPRGQDVERLKGYSPHVFHASQRAPRPPKMDPAMARALGGIKIRDRTGALGHIRFRVRDGEEVRFEVFGAASKV